MFIDAFIFDPIHTLVAHFTLPSSVACCFVKVTESTARLWAKIWTPCMDGALEFLKARCAVEIWEPCGFFKDTMMDPPLHMRVTFLTLHSSVTL